MQATKGYQRFFYGDYIFLNRIMLHILVNLKHAGYVKKSRNKIFYESTHNKVTSLRFVVFCAY